MRKKSLKKMVGIKEIREKSKAFLIQLQDLQWRTHALGEVVNITKLYAQNKDLFSREALDTVYNNSGLSNREDLFLFAFLLQERLGAITSHLEDKFGRLVVESKVKCCGEEIPYNNVIGELIRNKDRKRRKALRDALVEVQLELNKVLKEKDELSNKELEKLGYGNYIDLSGLIRLGDLEELKPEVQKFLDESKEVYVNLLQEFASKYAGVDDIKEIRRYDIVRLMSGIWWKDIFNPDDMIPSLKRNLDKLGLDLTAGGRILLHTEPLPKKSPRAACFSVKVPDDVRLTVKPMGGLGDYNTLYHEMGHAQHYAHIKEKEFEFQMLGSNTATETFAFLMENLLYIKDNLNELGLDDEKAREVIKFKALQRLFVIRRYAGKFLYELEWHSGKAKDIRDSYRVHLEKAYVYPMDEEDTYSYLIDHDDFFYSADYLRAWSLETALLEFLKQNIGEDWYKKQETATALKGLWKYGQKLLPSELAEFLNTMVFDPILLSNRYKSTIEAINN